MGPIKKTASESPVETRSVVLAGVGGQGTILAANILARALLVHGYDVKTSEVHGMAQRGGSVISMVRFGESVASPLVPASEAEVVVATELLEALRNVGYLAPGGKLIVARTRIDPLSVLQGAAVYPADAEDRIREISTESTLVDAIAIAREAGNARAANTVLLGILSRYLEVPEETWLSVMEDLVPAKVLDVNKDAFRLGRALD